jgi:hypothetical protein
LRSFTSLPDHDQPGWRSLEQVKEVVDDIEVLPFLTDGETVGGDEHIQADQIVARESKNGFSMNRILCREPALVAHEREYFVSPLGSFGQDLSPRRSCGSDDADSHCFRRPSLRALILLRERSRVGGP